MLRQRGLVGLMGLAALVGLGVMTKPATAKVTTEQSASILIFPKVVADGNRDTIIQITNTSNNVWAAHCFYVNGALTIPGLPPGPSNPPLWTETDFDIFLTHQQPTHWVVSTGRLDNPLDQTCRKTSCDPDSSGTDQADCCDAGYDPGHVPPVAPDFTGELKCIVTMPADGTPLPVANVIKGEATIVERSEGRRLSLATLDDSAVPPLVEGSSLTMLRARAPTLDAIDAFAAWSASVSSGLFTAT